MASMLQTERDFFLEETSYRGGTGGGSAFDWWNEIDDSGKLQQGLFYTLCASYAFVAFVALVQLFRIQLRVPEYGWTTQKVFHLMNFVVNGLRAILFGLYKSVFFIKPKVLEMVLLDLPGLLFFSTYTLLVLFWAEIYHQVRSLPINKLRPAYFIINGIVYFIQVCMWIYMRLSRNPIAVEVSRLFFSVKFIGRFMHYGDKRCERRGEEKQQKKGICRGRNGAYVNGCSMDDKIWLEEHEFQARCLILVPQSIFLAGWLYNRDMLYLFLVKVALSAFDKNADLDVLNHPILNFVYYMASSRSSTCFTGGRDCSICFGTLHPSKASSEANLRPVSSHPVKQAFAKCYSLYSQLLG
ncbi:hypothetical protein HHK36_004006 [Tetracentron sinense]|uniref:THH1/TOM1/TOM3 domain-containing protein n=1 Tax=Tetracentron sinense TaxID=13715 RepID=A0A834ZQ34_TETSI|nr:hypothetical protein HHK36_004006 [Tetracentron sinense]